MLCLRSRLRKGVYKKKQLQPLHQWATSNLQYYILCTVASNEWRTPHCYRTFLNGQKKESSVRPMSGIEKKRPPTDGSVLVKGGGGGLAANGPLLLVVKRQNGQYPPAVGS